MEMGTKPHRGFGKRRLSAPFYQQSLVAHLFQAKDLILYNRWIIPIETFAPQPSK